MNNPIKELHHLGQSIWYDNIERKLLGDGTLAGMIEKDMIRGITSNPSILNKAISNSEIYEEQLTTLYKNGLGKEDIYESLVISDIQAACDLFLPLYEKSDAKDGYVSLEVNPYLADDTRATIRDAERLWVLVRRPNLMVKIPATEPGLPAISAAIAEGININVTLIFSVERYGSVMEAYLEGLERRVKSGKPIENIASVASFFVSRIDTMVDERTLKFAEDNSEVKETALLLQGKLAIASAKIAYDLHKQIFQQDRFLELKRQGARLQRPLWASTSTKNPTYSDTKYVDELIGPNTVNTLPPETLFAFQDHGTAALTLERDLDSAQDAMRQLAQIGLSIREVTDQLEAEGVKAFVESYADLLETIELRRQELL